MFVNATVFGRAIAVVAVWLMLVGLVPARPMSAQQTRADTAAVLLRVAEDLRAEGGAGAQPHEPSDDRGGDRCRVGIVLKRVANGLGGVEALCKGLVPDIEDLPPADPLERAPPGTEGDGSRVPRGHRSTVGVRSRRDEAERCPEQQPDPVGLRAVRTERRRDHHSERRAVNRIPGDQLGATTGGLALLGHPLRGLAGHVGGCSP
jgi:hypothetical protein